MMDYRRLGNSGLSVSRICMGCMSFGDPNDKNRQWALDQDTSAGVIRKALDVGINFFDTANVYSAGMSETIVGNLLWPLVRREDIVLATKVFFRVRPGANGEGLSRKAIFQEIDASLTRLKTDYVDLYQIHRFDYNTPIEETAEALHDVVKAGKVRYIGASSMYAWQFMKMLKVQQQHGWTKFISMQDHVNLLYREEEREMLPLCKSEGIGVIPWSPLARGRLARPWNNTETKRAQTDPFGADAYLAREQASRGIVEAVQKLAAARNLPAAQVALAWVLQKEMVTAPIVGTTKPEQLDDAVAALSVSLSPEEIDGLEALYMSMPTAGFH